MKVREVECAYPPVGTVATICEVDGDGLTWSLDVDPGGKDCIDDREWELEAVATSPLYKALE